MEVNSSLYLCHARDGSPCHAEQSLDQSTLLSIDQSAPEFALGSASILQLQGGRVAEVEVPSDSYRLVAELIEVRSFRTQVSTRPMATDLHWRYYRLTGTGSNSLSPLSKHQWDSIVDPVELELGPTGEMVGVQRGRAGVLPQEWADVPTGMDLEVELAGPSDNVDRGDESDED